MSWESRPRVPRMAWRCPRNGYLSRMERVEAVHLSRALQSMIEAVRTGEKDFDAIEARAMQTLRARGWQPDYLVLRQRTDLQAAFAGKPLVALAAARIGSTRLIDSLEFDPI